MHSTGKETKSSYSPNFNSYYNTDLAEIAARVTTEFPDADDFAVSDDAIADNVAEDAEIGCDDDENDDDFEFDLSNLMPDDGEIRPVYPVFNRDLLRDFHVVSEIESRPSDLEEAESSKAQIQLKNLFLEDLDNQSSSSSDADEIDEIPPGTYCVWEPNKSPVASPSPGRCTKSNSTGSTVSVATGKAKTWKLTEFLKRSKSDGKEGIVVLTPKKKAEAPAVTGDGVKQRKIRPAKTAAAREGYYGGVRRKSYLPYRQDLVGFFATPQTFRKMHLPPF